MMVFLDFDKRINRPFATLSQDAKFAKGLFY